MGPQRTDGRDDGDTLLEEWIRREFCTLLGVESAGLHDDFFTLGGQSVSATQLLSRVGEMFHVQLPLRSFFEAPTIEALVRAVRERQAGKRGRLSASEGSQPLSFAQEGLWLIEGGTPAGPAYNIPSFSRLEGRLHVDALARALREIARRHEVLRTRFPSVDGKPSAVVDRERSLDLRVCDLESLSLPSRENEARRLGAELAMRPFDLARGPLARATLLRLSDREHQLLVVLHHIVSDGWSLGVLNRELTELYRAYRSDRPSSIPDLPLQYADFARWQREAGCMEHHLEYWKGRLNGWSVLELPYDRPRPRVATFHGDRETLTLPRALGDGLRALGRQQRATLFMMLLAGFQVALHRHTGQKDLLLGSPVANRTRAELEPLIGYFVNMLVMRTDLSGDPELREVLRRARESALGAYDHQELPFEKLVEELRPERDPGRNPLFQSCFSLQNAPRVPLALDGVRAVPIDAETHAARFDLALHVSEETGILVCTLFYSTDLFTRVTMKRFLAHWQTILSGIVTEPGCRVSEVQLLSAAERHQILEEWNDRATAPGDVGFHRLFEAQVDRTPDAVAVAFCDTADGGQWTYRELDERANRLAAHLRRCGVGPEVTVGLSLDRSFDLLAAILGVLKAGGAFFPIDPAYPEARRALLMEDCGARSVRLDDEAMLLEGPARFASDTSGSSLAYVMYTSGSTGTPQGIAVEHRGMCNLAAWQRDAFGLGPGDRVLQFSPIGFDAFVWELCMAWGAGAALILTSWETLSSPEKLAGLMRQESVTAATLSVTMLTALPEDRLPLGVVVSAGEPCPADLARRWAAGR
ncbi:MAG TPA: condensation domain-containing protein, partial [Vicinamibacteria bacterium]